MKIFLSKNTLHQLNLLGKKNVILPSLGTKISLKTEMATGLSLDRIIGRVTILHSFNAPFTMRDKATEYTKHSF
jgi:hypothetical protein